VRVAVWVIVFMGVCMAILSLLGRLA
jgi:hypothetical protein